MTKSIVATTTIAVSTKTNFSGVYSCLTVLFGQVKTTLGVYVDKNHRNLIYMRMMLVSFLFLLTFMIYPLLSLYLMTFSAQQQWSLFTPTHFCSSFYYRSFYPVVYFRSCSNYCCCNCKMMTSCGCYYCSTSDNCYDDLFFVLAGLEAFLALI